ncbi:MAG: hypothetical protein U0521_01370 [Anaerolineae bacterium]
MFIAALRVFDTVFVLTNGGPGKTTIVTSWLIYDETFPAQPRGLRLGNRRSRWRR